MFVSTERGWHQAYRRIASALAAKDFVQLAQEGGGQLGPE